LIFYGLGGWMDGWLGLWMDGMDYGWMDILMDWVGGWLIWIIPPSKSVWAAPTLSGGQLQWTLLLVFAHHAPGHLLLLFRFPFFWKCGSHDGKTIHPTIN
jgi:hypothetical protein